MPEDLTLLIAGTAQITRFICIQTLDLPFFIKKISESDDGVCRITVSKLSKKVTIFNLEMN